MFWCKCVERKIIIKKNKVRKKKYLLSFLALSFDFLRFIPRSTIGFSVKNERLITVKIDK